MTREEHISKHKELHKSLDELVADFITHTEGRLSSSTILDLIRWSYDQTINPKE